MLAVPGSSGSPAGLEKHLGLLYFLFIVLMHREHASRLGLPGASMETVTGVGAAEKT